MHAARVQTHDAIRESGRDATPFDQIENGVPFVRNPEKLSLSLSLCFFVNHQSPWDRTENERSAETTEHPVWLYGTIGIYMYR